MKFRFANLSVRLGSAPIEENNFYSVEHRSSSYLVRAAAFAEEFESALTFYVQLCEAMRSASEDCWFELIRRRATRLPSKVPREIFKVGFTHYGGLYGSVSLNEISALLNEFWLSDRFRLIGTGPISASTAVDLAAELDDIDLDNLETSIPSSIKFVIEKQYLRSDPFLALLVGEPAASLSRDLVIRAAAGFKRPLLEIGSGAWPPS